MCVCLYVHDFISDFVFMHCKLKEHAVTSYTWNIPIWPLSAQAIYQPFLKGPINQEQDLTAKHITMAPNGYNEDRCML